MAARVEALREEGGAPQRRRNLVVTRKSHIKISPVRRRRSSQQQEGEKRRPSGTLGFSPQHQHPRRGSSGLGLESQYPPLSPSRRDSAADGQGHGTGTRPVMPVGWDLETVVVGGVGVLLVLFGVGIACAGVHMHSKAAAPIFLAILSPPGNFAQRQAQRDTWLQDLPAEVDYRFFVQSTALYAPVLAREQGRADDLVLLPEAGTVPVGAGTGNGTRSSGGGGPNHAALLAALAFSRARYGLHAFGKLDDDVYVWPAALTQRLAALDGDRAAWLGSSWRRGRSADLDTQATRGWGLAELPAFNRAFAYFLSRRAVEHLADQALQPVGDREEVNLAVWLLAWQVRPTHEHGIVARATVGQTGRYCTAHGLLALGPLQPDEMKLVQRRNTRACALLTDPDLGLAGPAA